MGALAERCFALLERNACPPDVHLAIPPERVVELGARLEL
jgi:K+ transporter